MSVNQTLNSYFNRIKNSVFSVKDAANESSPWQDDGGAEEEHPKTLRGSSAGSATSSQDEGIHSTGEKEEDDINSEDLTKDDNEGIEEEEDQPGGGEDIQDNEEIPQQEEEEKEEEEEDEGRGSLAGDKEDNEIETDKEEQEEEENNENEEVATGYAGDSEDTPSISTMNETYLIEGEAEDKENIEEAEEVPNEDENEEAEAPLDETKNEEECEAVSDEAKDVTEIGDISHTEEIEAPDISIAADNEEIANDESVENTEEVIPEEPAIAKLPGTKFRKKKKDTIDTTKVTAKRKPFSIRFGPPSVPVSSTKENKSIKPHLKLFSNKKFKLKKGPLGNLGRGASDANNAENEVSSILMETNRTSKNDGDPQTSEAAERLNNPDNKDGEGRFLNPHMDHSLERPRAPYKSKGIKTPRSNSIKSRSGAEANCEVWVPEEDKLYVYSYSSVPRILHVKRLGKRVSTTDAIITDPKSTSRLNFRSGRVIRGSNFGKDGVPQWNPYFAYARCLSKDDYMLYETEEMRERREEFRKKLQERAKGRRSYHGISSVYRTNTQHPTIGQFDSISEGEELQKTPVLRRSRPSISVATQVTEKERSSQLLYTGSSEEVLIRALVLKTIREARVEVATEAEADRTKLENAIAERMSGVGGPPAEVMMDEDVEETGEGPNGEEMSPEGEELPPDGAEEAPDGEEMDAQEEETAADEEEAPADEEEAPADEEEAPADEEEAPADEEEAPADEEETPADEEEAPPDGEEVPPDEEEPAPDETKEE